MFTQPDLVLLVFAALLCALAALAFWHVTVQRTKLIRARKAAHPAPSKQLTIIRGSQLRSRALLDRQDRSIHEVIEAVVDLSDGANRLMAQVSLICVVDPISSEAQDPHLGHLLRTKRVDFLVINQRAEPLAAILVERAGDSVNDMLRREIIEHALQSAQVPSIVIGRQDALEDVATALFGILQPDAPNPLQLAVAAE